MDKKSCFVLMPFRDPFDQIYSEIIKPCVEENGLECTRADEIYSSRPVMSDIWNEINNASIIIAEMTGRREGCLMRRRSVLLSS